MPAGKRPAPDNVVAFPQPEGSGDERVLLTRHQGAIAAKFFMPLPNPDERYEVGVEAECRDGTRVRYSYHYGCPVTRAELYGINLASPMSYSGTKRRIMAVENWEFDEEVEWLKTDAQGVATPETDTYEVLAAWLQVDLQYDDRMRLDIWIRRWASEVTPGYELLAALPTTEIARLGLREAQAWFSGCCVMTDAPIRALNQSLAAYELPYFFVDDGPPVERAWEETSDQDCHDE